jgi:hypothetical protein
MSSQGWAAAGQMLNRMTGILETRQPAALTRSASRSGNRPENV